MSTSTSSSPPGAPGPREPRHRASAGRGYGRETEPSGPIPVARRDGGRHRAPDAPPSSGFTIVPGPRDAGPDEAPDGPAAGFRPLPPPSPAAPSSPGVSSVGVPLGAVPTQRGPAVPRRRPAAVDLDAVLEDEAVTLPVRRDALDRAAAHDRAVARERAETAAPPIPPLRPLTVHRPEAPRPGSAAPARPEGASSRAAPRPADPRPPAPRRGIAPWETPPVDGPSTRLGLAAIVVGLVGALIGLAPRSGLLPRVLPAAALGATPVFNLVGALLGVVALGVGAIAMFRASQTSRGLLAGVVGACAGAAAIVVGLVV